jgi:hypothetical protein
MPTQWTELHLFRNINSLPICKTNSKKFFFITNPNKILAVDFLTATNFNRPGAVKCRPFGNTEW